MGNKRTARQAAYDKTHTVKLGIKLNKKTDADILARLAVIKQKDGSMQGYIKKLVRNDMQSFVDCF